MNTWIATCSLAISIALTGLIVEWLARHAHPRRLFLMSLGRPRTADDDRRALRLRRGRTRTRRSARGRACAPSFRPRS